MYILKNGNVILRNSEVSTLQIVNTNGFSFGVVTIGPISISWGDGSYTNVGVKSTRFNITKTYSSIGTYNINITGVDNITGIYIDHTSYGSKINTSVIWFNQFSNLVVLYFYNTSFYGELGQIINTYLKKLLSLYYGTNNCTINLNDCSEFCGRALAIRLTSNFIYNFVICDFTNLIFNKDIILLELNSPSLSGCLDNIINTQFTKIEIFIIYTEANDNMYTNLDMDSITLPDTCRVIQFGGWSSPYDINDFVFNKLTSFSFAKLKTSNVDLTNNISFKNSVSNNITSFTFWALSPSRTIKLNLDDLTRSTYIFININPYTNTNLCYGDIGSLISKMSGQFWFTNGKVDGSGNYLTTGTITRYEGKTLFLNCSNVILTADVYKNIAIQTGNTALVLSNLPNFTGDISNTIYTSNLNYWNGFGVSYMPNLYCDITTLVFNTTHWSSSYGTVIFNNNPHFTGDLGNLTLWSNKSQINLSNCAYTNIPGFINKIFTNRNTCLKATGGMTTISVQNNVDNASLTGTNMWPNLGTYTGSVHNLTEAQIDFLAQGLDYTGNGTNTPWLHKEKIYFLSACQNSSTDVSKRYRVTINY